MTHDTAFPFLTVLVLLPAGAAVVAALVPASLGERAQRARGVRRRAGGVARHVGPGHHHRAALSRRQRRVPAREPARVGAVARDLVAPRRRRDLRVPPAHGGGPVPARHRGRQGAEPAPVLRGVDAAARGGMPRELRVARPDHVLLVLRADARARVLRHDRVGIRGTGLRGDQVLRLHLLGLGLLVGGDRGRRLHPPAPDRPSHLRPRRAHHHPPGSGVAGAAVPRLHRRLRREGARSSPSTRGRPAPMPSHPRGARSSWPRSWPRWAPTASSASTSTCSPGPWSTWPRCCSPWAWSASSTGPSWPASHAT